MNRRAFLATSAPAAAAAALAIPVATRADANPDAAIVAAFQHWREASNPPDDLSDEDFEAFALVEQKAGGIVADTPAYGASGVSIKLAFLACEARDHSGHDDPEHPAVRTMASLTASIPHLPPELAIAVRVAVEESARTMRLLAEGNRLAFEHQRVAGEWRRYDRIFSETNAYDAETANLAQSQAEPPGAAAQGRRTLEGCFTRMTPAEKRTYMDALSLTLLGLRVHRSLKALAGDNHLAAGPLAILREDFQGPDTLGEQTIAA